MNPWIHAILSFFIPGLGQVISREYLIGICFFIIAVAIDGINFYFFGNSLLGNIIGIIYALIAAYSAYVIQKNIEERKVEVVEE